jgi:hypothetical protein
LKAFRDLGNVNGGNPVPTCELAELFRLKVTMCSSLASSSPIGSVFTVDEVLKIEREGIKNNWPPL